ncbi:MAG: PASTA domain-containing protein [Acidobacteriota bacterium]
MSFRSLVAAFGALACVSAALANDVQFHICAAAQNLGQAYARTRYFNGEIGPDQSAEVAANLANAAAHIAAAEAGVEQPFATYPARQHSIAELQGKIASYAELAPRLSPAGRMTKIQDFYTHYRFALSLSYASNRPDDFRWNPTCDSQMLDANWHLGLAATYAAVRFERGTVEETHARSAQGGANSSAFQAIRVGLRQALDGTGPTPLEHCFFNTEQAWSIVPMLPADEPWETYVGLLPRVLEVCHSAGPHGGLPGHRVTVPGVAGLLLADAKRRLTEAGLTVQLGPGSPAPSAADTGRVEAQSVAAGTLVTAGTPVRLTVHSPYVPPRTVVPTPVPSPAETQRPSWECDLKGSYDGNRFRVTLENGRYIGRDYSEANDLPEMRRRGFHVGYVQFDVGTELEYFVDRAGLRRAGFRGWCGDGHGGDRPLAWADCWVAQAYGFVAGPIGAQHGAPKKLAIQLFVIRDGVLTNTLMSHYHDTYEYPNGCWDVAPSPTVTPAPVFQVPTPVPTAELPPSPPACPGPAVTVIYDLWNPPPYGGLGGVVCRDGAGGMYINIANNIYRVNSIRTGTPDPSTGCFVDTGVVTPHHTYGGTLCPK